MLDWSCLKKNKQAQGFQFLNQIKKKIKLNIELLKLFWQMYETIFAFSVMIFTSTSLSWQYFLLFSSQTIEMILFLVTYLTLIGLGFFRVVFPEWESPSTTTTPFTFIFQEELILYQYNFIRLLKNLFKLC